jgi:mannose-6-phosphate isomerase
MRPLANPVRPYAWGSRSAIAVLQGRPVPSPGPEAELWLGAHPSAPSLLPTGSLPAVIAANPVAALGQPVVDRFGARLPYLLKVLAAAEPLSLQVHPDSGQAAAGYAAWTAATASAGAGDVDVPPYADPFHKPELLVALDDFDGLCGFRDPAVSAEALAQLRVPALDSVVRALAEPTASTETRLRSAVESLLVWPGPDRAKLVAAVAAAGEPLTADLAKRYPGDVGVVLALLLHRVRLRPDEAIFMPAGNLHAYLSGIGVEVMAASDNVARAGLTPKPVDPAEVMRLLHYGVLADPVVRPVEVAPGVMTWPTPVTEFALHKAAPAGGTAVLPAGGPRIVLCVQGPALLVVGDQRAPVRGGEAVFVEAGEPAVELVGDDAVIFQVSCP